MKGGGGGGGTPHIQTPPGLTQTTNALGDWGNNLLFSGGAPASLANWAAAAATGMGGGNQIQGLQPSGNGSQIGIPGAEQFGAGAGNSSSYLTAEQNIWNQISGGNLGGSAYTAEATSNPITNVIQPSQDPTAWATQQAGKWVTIGGVAYQVSTDPKFIEAIKNAQQNGTKIEVPQGGANLEVQQGAAQTKQGISDVNQANQQYQNLLTGNGLFGSQQATIDQAVAEQKKAIDQQLASMGLGNSTMGAQLKGQADLSGAAEAGKLVQGNLGIAQQEQAIAQQEESLGINLQTTGTNQLMAVAQANAAQQAQLWQEAMQGYGALGTMMDEGLKAYGYKLSGYQIQAQINTAQAQIEANQQAAQQAADQQGFSSMLGGLGSLLGGGKGGGGGLLGSLGGLIGGGGSALAAGGGAGAGAAAGAAAGGAGAVSAVGSAISALGAAFCGVAREVFGDGDPRWLLFRDWLLFKGPRWLRKFYIRHAIAISQYIADKPLLKWMIRNCMSIVIGDY